jgi:hypothetical protein
MNFGKRVLCGIAAAAMIGTAFAQTKPAVAENVPAAKPGEAPKGTAAPTPAPASATPAAPGAVKLNYLPPGKGTPSRREGGATRGGDLRELALSVVAPEHVGWSSREQPDIYWFVSRPVTTPVILTITQVGGAALDPLFEGKLAAPANGGIHAISLKDLRVTLAGNADYEWSISLVGDPQSRSRDVMASGRVRWVPLAADARATLAGLPVDQQAEKLASSGYWYDVVDLLRRRSAGSASEVSLYESAGLTRIAKFLRDGV